MKEWIKKTDDKELSSLFKEINNLKDVPSHLDLNLNLMLDNYQKTNKYQTNKKLVFKNLSSPRNISFVLVTLSIVAVIIFTVNLFFIKPKSIDTYSYIIKGDNKQINLSDKKLTVGDKIIESDFINTNDNQCNIRFGNEAVIKLNDNTKLRFEKLRIFKKTQNHIKLKLIQGEVHFSVNRMDLKSVFTIETENAFVNVKGTKFIVRFSDNATSVFVREGKVNIRSKKTKKEIDLTENQTVSINKQETEFVVDKVEDEYLFSEFDYLNIPEIISNKKVIFHTEINNTILVKDNNEITSFFGNLEILLNEGNYQLKSIIDNKEYFKDIYITNNLPETQTITFNKSELKQISIDNWTSEKIYNSKNKIIGYVKSENLIIFVTKKSIFCINNKNNIIWNNDYSTEGITFNSSPSIKDNFLFISFPLIFTAITLLIFWFHCGE